MTTTRDLVYVFINNVAKDVAKNGLIRLQLPVEAGSVEDDYLHGLLNKVEDDRVHYEANELRARAEELSAKADNLAAESMVDAYRLAANDMDPYEKRDGKLYRKSDGKEVLI
jgi:hypothetical protein